MKRFSILLSILISCVILNFNIIFADTTFDTKRIEEVINIIKENYKDEVSEKQLIDGAIKGMLKTLDPYSVYLTKQEYEQMIESLSGEFSGIGVSIKKIDKYIEIIEIIKNSPAQKAGLRVGDKFYSVDGTSVVDIDPDVFVSMVRGPKGTKVKVGILRGNSEKPIYFEITRDVISVSPVEYKIMNNNIGYLRIYSFNANVERYVTEALGYFDKNQISKIIIDLRGNPGGYLNEVVDICKKIIPEGPIVHIKRKDGFKETYYSYLKNTKYKLAVLIDEGSASASEILGGAVQDYKVGVLIGTKSYGKGTVQTVFQLSNGDYVKLSIAKYLTPKEREIDGIGLIPDIVVNDNTNEFEPVNIVRNIYLGSTGNDVLAVEQRLKALGYITSEPDYKYDLETKTGVIKFKKEHKLLPNSIITRQFQRILEEETTQKINVDYPLQKAIEVLSQ